MYELQIDDERLEDVVRTIREAGNRVATVKENVDSERKTDGSIVTEADREAENIIREDLKNSYAYPVLGEESGGNIDESDTYWVVDPIDGTRNFSNYQPLYGTSISLIEDGEPYLGVFYMPELDYIFYAVDGEGAYRNEEQIQVSSGVSTDEAYYCISGIGRTEIHSDVSQLNRWVQQLGCAIMGESWVASGWCDIGVFGALGPWDIATGVVLVREAGGTAKCILSDNSTNWDDMMNGKVLLGDEELVNEFLEEIPATAFNSIEEASYKW